MLVMRSASELEVSKLVGSAVAERDAVMHDEVGGCAADDAGSVAPVDLVADPSPFPA